MSLAQNHNKITSLLLLPVLFLNGKLHQQKHPLCRFFYIVDRQRNTTLALTWTLLPLSSCLTEVSVLWKVRKTPATGMVVKKNYHWNKFLECENKFQAKIMVNSTTLNQGTWAGTRPLLACLTMYWRTFVSPQRLSLWVCHKERARITLLLPVSGGLLEHRTGIILLSASPSNSQHGTQKKRGVAATWFSNTLWEVKSLFLVTPESSFSLAVAWRVGFTQC